MVGQTQYYVCKYDTLAGGSFTPEGANLTWPTGESGWIVSNLSTGATTGILYIALLSANAPINNQTLTQGGVTALADGDAVLIDYQAYIREDLEISGAGAISWDSGAPALGTTHSFWYDGSTHAPVVGEILTFADGQKCEVITVVAADELDVRWITNIDVLGYPDDNDTFTGDDATPANGALNGVVHERVYSPYMLHRFLQDLGDNSDIYGDDDLSRVDPVASSKDTPEIVNLLGNMAVNDTVVQHMYGGSIAQDGGATLYSGINVQVTSPLDSTQPVLIKNNAIITDYWKNAYMPDSVKGNVRIMTKTREDGVDFDGKRIKGKLLEYGEIYFIGGTTLGLGATALALFSSADGNNNTAAATVAGAPYNSVVLTEGYQTIDYNNGNGATPFGFKMDYGTANSAQAYERMKWIQRRGTSQNLFGANAQYFDGYNLNFAYDGESGGPFSEDEIIYWGTEVTYTGQTVNFQIGEVLTFSGGAKGRLLYMNDAGASGTLIIDIGEYSLSDVSGTITGETSGGNGSVNTVGTNTVAGSARLCALNDLGANGNMYCSLLTGLAPVDNSEIYGGTSDADCLVNGTPQTRTINNQWWGVYTGSAHQPNFGIGLDSSDATKDDLMTNLLGASQSPPDNQIGAVTDLKLGDTVTVYPYDGSSTDANGDPEPNYDEQALAVALTSGVSTVVNVGAGNIPERTPQAGFLRIEQDSDSNLILVEYDSHDEDDEYQIVGTSPITAAISNTVMRALIDEERSADGNSSYTAKYEGTSEQVVIKVQNGYTAVKNGPLKPFITTAAFGSGGFSVKAVRTSDA